MVSSTRTPAPLPGAAVRSAPGLARRLGFLALFAAALPGCAKYDSTAPSSGGPLSFVSNPCLAPDTVQVGVAQAQRIDCSNNGTTAIFAGGGASYLVVPEFATDAAPFAFVEYAVDSGTVMAAVKASWAAARTRRSAEMAAINALPAVRLGEAQRLADGKLRARGRRLAAAIRASRAQLPQAALGGPRRSPPPQGSVRAFQVLSDLLGTSDTWATVNAQLQYIGTNVLLYVDTLAPAGGFTLAQLQTYGQYFDQTLFPIDTAAFGPPTDVDGNGRVIVLMSNTVNADTPTSVCQTQGYVAGFFNEEDFSTTASDPHSNQGEIFYTILPDPAGQYSCAHTASDVEFSAPPTFLHELQHLINFSQHVVVGGGAPLSSWLDEGLSIVAEELGSVYYEQKCPAPACRTDASQLFPDSSQAFIQDFLYDSYEYALLPDTASILLENDADPGISWRGGAWLLVRWLADQKGAGVLRQLETGPSDGVQAIAQVMGEPFPQAFADFGLALYTDSLPGLPRATAPPADRFVTRNLSQLWARLYATSGPATDIPLPMPVQLFPITTDTTTLIVYPGTVTYFRLDTPPNASTVAVRFAGPGGYPFNFGLQPQLAVFRLPPGQ